MKRQRLLARERSAHIAVIAMFVHFFRGLHLRHVADDDAVLGNLIVDAAVLGHEVACMPNHGLDILDLIDVHNASDATRVMKAELAISVSVLALAKEAILSLGVA